eukprot:138740-Chlamydomonas_euryale.AAC.3
MDACDRRMCAWTHGCMGVRMCAWTRGCMGVRMGAWTHGCMGVRMGAWTRGCMGVRMCAWTHGCMGVRMGAWTHGCMVHSAMDSSADACLHEEVVLEASLVSAGAAWAVCHHRSSLRPLYIHLLSRPTPALAYRWQIVRR